MGRGLSELQKTILMLASRTASGARARGLFSTADSSARMSSTQRSWKRTSAGSRIVGPRAHTTSTSVNKTSARRLTRVPGPR
jgi:hypothetical protein